MRPTKHVVRSISAVVMSFLVPTAAMADVAPPNMPPGSNPSPDAQTKVQMAAERITISVREIENTSPAYVVGDVAAAQVDGTFTMHNTGKAPESMQVRFPLADPSGQGSGFFTYPEVQNFSAGVDGQVLPTTVISVPNPLGDKEPAVRWAAFDVTFPITRDVMIRVSYSISPTGYLPEAVFAYVLSTGAGWFGPIGKADIIMRLPYPATSENVVLDHTIKGARFIGGEVRWHWTNLEPTPKDDWHATILTPNVWRGIVEARLAQRKAPRNAQRWLELSKAYIEAVPLKYEPMGGERFIKLGVQAMQRAVTLAPRNATMHVEYANLLWYLYRFQVAAEPNSKTGRILMYQLDLALKLDPKNAQALALKKEIEQEINQNK